LTYAKVIVDTCIWIDYFKGVPKIKEDVATLISEHSLCLCGIVIYELLQGIKDAKEKEMVKSDLDAFPYLAMNRSTWERVANLLRHEGIAIPSSDLILASLATENRCKVFTQDTHFDKIPDISLYHP
jgi:predicted nucleic acid-binding protein